MWTEDAFLPGTKRIWVLGTAQREISKYGLTILEIDKHHHSKIVNSFSLFYLLILLSKGKPQADAGIGSGIGILR